MAAPTTNPTAIRTDAVARLVAASTVAGSRVYDSRRIDVDTDELPVIVVTSAGGTETRLGMRSLMTRRSEKLQIAGVVTGTTDAALAAAVDAIEEDILDAFMGDPEWLGAFREVTQAQSEKSLDIGQNKRVGAVMVGFDLEYDLKYVPVAASVAFHDVALTTASTDPDGADVSERVIALAQT